MINAALKLQEADVHKEKIFQTHSYKLYDGQWITEQKTLCAKKEAARAGVVGPSNK